MSDTRLRRPLGRLFVPVLAVALLLGFAGLMPSASADTPPPTPPVTTDPATATADSLPTVQINGVVWRQVIVGNTVYVGGQFTNARPAGSAAGTNTVARSNMLSYDINTGVLNTSFAPVFNGKVNDVTVTPDHSKLIAVGTFTQVNGLTRNRAAVFNLSADGSTATLSTTVVPNLNGETDAVAATNSRIFFGGWFGAVNGTSRPRVAAVSATDGSLVKSFSVPVDNQSVQTIVVSPDGSSIVFGGNFTSVGGSDSPGYGLARVDSTTGTMQDLPVNAVFRDGGLNAGVTRLQSDGNSFYGGGWVYGSGGNSEGAFQANWSDGNLVTLEDCHGDTYDVAPVGDVMYIASHEHYCGNSGGFPQTDPWTVWHGTAWTKTVQGTNTADLYGYPDHPGTPRPGLLPFFPDFTNGTYTGKGQATWTVTGNSKYVLYGGEFPKVNGVAQQGLARFTNRATAPNLQGPRPASGTSYAPTVKSIQSGTAKVSWPALWDRDDKTLTYQVYRNNTSTKVFETTQTNFQWNGQPMSFTDTGLTPGSTVKYAIRTLDPSGNLLNSSWVTATVANGDLLGTYGNAVLTDGASKYWRLDDSGTAVSDWAGADDTTAGSGVTRGTTGALANSSDTASTFDGTANDVVVSKQLVPGPNTFSEEAWFKTTSTTGGKIAGFGSSASGDSGNYDRHIYMDGDGRVYFGVWTGNAQTVNSAAGLNDGNWHQVVATLGSGGETLYIDGVRVDSRTDVATAQPYDGYWRIGGDNTWAGDKYFNGSIDEFAVYPTVLSKQQVNAHWVASGRVSTVPPEPSDNLGKAMYDSNPDTYWRLDETGNVSTAADSALGTNTGTYSGNVTLGQPGVPGGGGTSIQLGAPHDSTDGGNVTATRTVTNPTSFSQEVWIKTSTTTGGRILGLGNSGNGSFSSNYDRQIYMLDSGKVRWGVYNGNTVTIDSKNALNDGQWHQIVTTFDANGMKLYVDGSLDSSDPNNTAQNYTGYWKLGGDSTWGGNSSSYFTGNVDEAAVYPRALPASEVQSHFAAGGTGSTPVNPPPTAKFTSTATKLSASFDASTSDGGGDTISSYSWNFGDGMTGTGATPTHAYAMGGTYNVTLTVTDQGGATDTVFHAVTVIAPTAKFTSNVTNMSASFDASASDGGGDTISGYSWNFGDGSTGSGVSPSHGYTTAGTKTVTLTVTDQGGAQDIVSHDITVTAASVPPTAKFSSNVTNMSASFDASASDGGSDTISSYSWSFGDGSTGTGVSPSHSYTAAGTKTVTLTVTDQGGAQDIVSHTITVTPPSVPPTAKFSSNVTNMSASFDASASDGGSDTISSYSWSFGDGSTGTGVSPSHSYTAAGTKTVTLTVTDQGGAQDIVSHDITVTAPPTGVLASDAFNRNVTNGWGTADTGGPWTIRGTASRASVSPGSAKFTLPSALTMYADLNNVSSTSSRVTSEFSVDKLYSGSSEGMYVAATGRQVGADYYAARLVLAPDGSVKMYLLRDSSALLAAYTVPGLTIVPGAHYKLSVLVTGTPTTTVSAKVWKATDTEPAAWQRSATNTFAALQAPGRVGVFAYLPAGTTNAPITVSFYNLVVSTS